MVWVCWPLLLDVGEAHNTSKVYSLEHDWDMYKLMITERSCVRTKTGATHTVPRIQRSCAKFVVRLGWRFSPNKLTGLQHSDVIIVRIWQMSLNWMYREFGTYGGTKTSCCVCCFKGNITFEYVTCPHEGNISNISIVFFIYYINLIDARRRERYSCIYCF